MKTPSFEEKSESTKAPPQYCRVRVPLEVVAAIRAKCPNSQLGDDKLVIHFIKHMLQPYEYLSILQKLQNEVSALKKVTSLLLKQAARASINSQTTLCEVFHREFIEHQENGNNDQKPEMNNMNTSLQWTDEHAAILRQLGEKHQLDSSEVLRRLVSPLLEYWARNPAQIPENPADGERCIGELCQNHDLLVQYMLINYHDLAEIRQHQETIANLLLNLYYVQ